MLRQSVSQIRWEENISPSLSLRVPADVEIKMHAEDISVCLQLLHDEIGGRVCSTRHKKVMQASR